MCYCDRCDEPVEVVVTVIVTDNGVSEEFEVCPECVESTDKVAENN